MISIIRSRARRCLAGYDSMTHNTASRSVFRTLAAVLAVASIGAVAPIHPAAAVNNIDFSALNRNLTRNHVLPRYQFLASSAEQMRNEINGFCANPSKGNLPFHVYMINVCMFLPLTLQK